MIAGRSQPTTVGTSTRVDSTTCAAAGNPRRYARRRQTVCQREDPHASAIRCSRRTRHHPPAMRASSNATPISHTIVMPGTIRSSWREAEVAQHSLARPEGLPPRRGRNAVDFQIRSACPTLVVARPSRAAASITGAATGDWRSVHNRRAVTTGAASIAARPTHAKTYLTLADRRSARRSATAATAAIAHPCHTKWISAQPAISSNGVIGILRTWCRAAS